MPKTSGSGGHMGAQHILDAPVGADIAGYTVVSLLGAGGCAVVYRATQGEEEVALKLQSLEHLGEWAEREVAILSRLKHRNVVGFRGCGLFPESRPRWFYLALEHVSGRTLSRWVEEENPGARRAAELLRGLARGLEATHAAEVLHGDIKESNVVVREADGEPVLVDFGAGDYAGAPCPSSCLSSDVLPPGTPRYRSPEALAFRRDSREGQLERYVPTHSDDLYALGVVFYQVLTARHPFEGAEMPSEVEAVISEVPGAPHVLNPRVPRVLSELCMRLTSKRPEERGSAKELREAVEAALAGTDSSWEVPLREQRPAESMVSWSGANAGEPPRRGWRPKPVDGAEPVDARALAVPTLVVRAPLASGPEPREEAGVLFRASALLGMAMGMAIAAMVAMEWRPSGLLSAMTGSVAGTSLAEPMTVTPSATPPPTEDALRDEKKTFDMPSMPASSTVMSRSR